MVDAEPDLYRAEPAGADRKSLFPEFGSLINEAHHRLDVLCAEVAQLRQGALLGETGQQLDHVVDREGHDHRHPGERHHHRRPGHRCREQRQGAGGQRKRHTGNSQHKLAQTEITIERRRAERGQTG